MAPLENSKQFFVSSELAIRTKAGRKVFDLNLKGKICPLIIDTANNCQFPNKTLPFSWVGLL